MRRKKRRFALKLVFLTLFILLGILATQAGRLILSVRPPTGNPTLESIKAKSGENRQTTASVHGMKGSPTPITSASEPPVTESTSDGQTLSDSVPAQEPIPASDEIYYFLLAGLDAAYAKMDAILLAGLNITDKTLRILNIPRDTMSGSDRFNKQISAAWELGGIVQLEKEITDLTGIMVNRYILTTHEGIEKMGNTLGGGDFNVLKDMEYDVPAQEPHNQLGKDNQQLTGEHAFQLARYGSDHRDGDIGRISMQQELIMAIAEQLLRSADMAKLGELAGIAMEHFETDLTMGEILWLAETLKATSFEDVRFYTLPGRFETIDGLSYWIPDKENTAEIIQEFR